MKNMNDLGSHWPIKTSRLLVYESDGEIVDQIETGAEASGIDKLVSGLTEEKRKDLAWDTRDLIDFYQVVTALASRENAAYFEAQESGRVIGYVALKRYHTEMPEIQIALLPTHRHQGYGHELLTAVLRHTSGQRPDLKFLYRAGPYNSASIALAEKIGGVLLAPTSTLEGYFFKTYRIDPATLHGS